MYLSQLDNGTFPSFTFVVLTLQMILSFASSYYRDIALINDHNCYMRTIFINSKTGNSILVKWPSGPNQVGVL